MPDAPHAKSLPRLGRGSKEAPPVLFLHGFMGRAVHWLPVWSRMEGGHRCLAVDLPGHGAATGRPEAAYTMEGAAAALTATLDEAGIDQATVVGYSMGGRLALYFALHFPARCRRLVLESASPGLATENERAARRRTDAERARHIRSDYRAFLEDWYRMPLFASLARHGLVDATIDRRLRDNDPVALGRSLRGMGTGRQPSLWLRLSALECPALILTGALDAKYVRVTREMAEQSQGRLARVVVEEAGHNVHAERPAAFAQELNAFLNDGAQAAAGHFANA